MIDLPVEILILILKNLELKDIIKCKLLNKKFNYLITNLLKLDCLVILDKNNYKPINKKWFHTNNSINCLHLITRSNYKFINGQLNRDLFISIKRLYILNKDVSINFLNNFKQLIQLELVSSLNSEPEDDILNLEYLKIISLYDYNEDLALNTPKLESINLNKFNRDIIFKILYMNSIKLIKCSNYHYLIKKLLNLEILYCKYMPTKSINSDFLIKLSKLKEIHLDYSKQTVLELIKQKQQLNRDQLDIYLFGFNFINLEKQFKNKLLELADQREPINEFGNTITYQTINIYSDNYNNLANNLLFIKKINYNSIEEYFPKQSIELCRKFIDLYTIEITRQIKDLNRFKEFKQICSSFDEFNLSSLNQEFFNLLPYLIPNIKSLIFINCSNLDFNFLLNFNSIGYLKTDFNLSSNIYRNLFKKYVYLNIYCENDDHNFTISRKNQNCYQLIDENIGNFSFMNLDFLFNFYNKYNYQIKKNKRIKIDKSDLLIAKKIDNFDEMYSELN